MRVAKLRSKSVHLKLEEPFAISYKVTDSADVVVIEMEFADGQTGLGACAPFTPVTGESIDATRAALDPARLAWLFAMEWTHPAQPIRRLASDLAAVPGARAALDIALHDAWAKSLGLPLVDCFGRAHDAMPTSVTLGIEAPEVMAEKAAKWVGRGFDVLKVKLGQGLDGDLAILRALRDAHGDKLVIRVDPNQAYDIATLRSFLDQTREIGLEMVEQPLDVDSTRDLLELDEADRRLIALDEALHSERDAVIHAVAPQPAGIYNIKFMKCGGCHAAQRIATVAEIAGIDLMWGCNSESVISLAAAFHTAMASPATRYLDLDGDLDLLEDVAHGGYSIEGGVLRALDKPGLGITLDFAWD